MALTWPDETGAKQGMSAGQRVIAALLLLLMVVGSFVLWVGVPAVVLWGLGKLISNPTGHLILGLIAVPVGMVVFGLLLAGLNASYLRLSGAPFPPDDDDETWTPRLRGPLDRIVAGSAIVALVVLVVWVVVGGVTVGDAPPW